MVLHTPLEGRSPRVVACSERAARRRVRTGMPVAEAQAQVPRGWFSVSDPAADREHLRRLAWQCQRFTPLAGLEPAEVPESLFLEVTGSAAHFGGLDRLCRQVVDHFQQQGYRVKLAAAPTFGAAWALVHQPLSRHGQPARPSSPVIAVVDMVEPAELHGTLSRLPVRGLRLPAEVLSLLSECGLVTIGELLDLPRPSLPSRFGPQLLLRLDQALGNVSELLEPEFPPIPVQATSRFEFPVRNSESLLLILRRLLEKVLDQLRERRRETQQLQLQWTTEDGDRGEFDLRLLRPTAAPDRLWELLTLKWESLQLTGGIVSVQLEALACIPLPRRRATLFAEEEAGEVEFSSLIERLSSRLGEQAVVRFRLVPDAQPELAAIAEPWLSRQEDVESRPPEEPLIRPLKLLPAPVLLRGVVCSNQGRMVRFRWRQQDHAVASSEGPERIVTGWWRGKTVRRDYYRVETTRGARLWLFRSLESSQWYLQGLFE